LFESRLDKGPRATLACIRTVLLERQLIDSGTTEDDLLERYISVDPRRRDIKGRSLLAIFAELVRDYGIDAEAAGGLTRRSTWRRIHRALQGGWQPIVLVSGVRFNILFPGLRVLRWPWHAVIVTRVERGGLRQYVYFYDARGESTSSERRLSLRAFQRSRYAGMVSVCLWRYLWQKVPDLRERVPVCLAYLLVGRGEPRVASLHR
jgi:hypothetical protein